MKKITQSLAVMAITFFCFNNTYAQDDFDELLETGIEDATKLIEGYVNPFMKGFGTGLGSGWYNTAKAHKSLGFDITANVSLAYIPDDDLFYNTLSLGLSENTRLINPADGRAPTMFGPDITVEYEYDPDPNGPMSSPQVITGPSGLGIEDEVGFNAVPVVMPQIGIGIVKNTDLKVRWLPEITIGDNGKLNLFGLGVLHDVKQHIPGMKNLPFDLSAFLGFTKVGTDIDLANGAMDPNGEPLEQRGEFKINTWTFQALISKKFSVLTLYGGLGFNKVKSELNMVGKYDINDDGDFEDSYEVNPLALDFKAGGPRLTAGMRLKLAILTLHADYTLQEYKTLTVGVGFSVR